ncbi:MAG TPA: hypothetical protein DDZ78_07815 [Porphyromonadaceae bacterium]|nr:hypothetical protein [Porphyromonadaceae bacterium]
MVETLYINDYFGFKDEAKKYVEELVREVEKNIDTMPKKKAPRYFSKYGDGLYYIRCRRNKATTWYFFFSIRKDGYYIEYIGNNHIIAQYL